MRFFTLMQICLCTTHATSRSGSSHLVSLSLQRTAARLPHVVSLVISIGLVALISTDSLYSSMLLYQMFLPHTQVQECLLILCLRLSPTFRHWFNIFCSGLQVTPGSPINVLIVQIFLTRMFLISTCNTPHWAPINVM